MVYELHLTTMHCIGRLDRVVGTVGSQKEAEAWACGDNDGGPDPGRALQEDPIVWCPVKHCHMKRQKPVRSYCACSSG